MPKLPIIVRPSNLKNTRITLYGDWFKFTSGYGVYLSANKPELNTDVVDLYSEDPKLIVKNPSFNGIAIKDYTAGDNNLLEFLLPEDLISADYDIIVCNPAGYVKATSISLNVLKVVGVFEFKEFKSISGNKISSIEASNILTIRQRLVYDFAPATNVTINNQNTIFTITGDNIYSIRRFLTSN